MNTKLRAILNVIISTAGMLTAPSVVRADDLNLTLLSPVFGGAGSTIPITGTIAAPSSNFGTVFLNSESSQLAGPFTLDDTPFLLNAPLSMNPGSTYTAVLFDVQVDRLAPQGTYTGSFIILGGSNASAQIPVSNSASFSVTVIPEPASIILLGVGLGGIMLWRVDRRRRSES